MDRSLSPRRLLSLTLVIATLCLCAAASAAALNGIATADLGVGSALVATCDPDGVTLTQITSGSTVTDLSVTGIDGACAGGDLSVTLAAADGSVVATAGPTTVSGTSATLVVTPTPEVGDFVSHHLRIIGP